MLVPGPLNVYINLPQPSHFFFPSVIRFSSQRFHLGVCISLSFDCLQLHTLLPSLDNANRSFLNTRPYPVFISEPSAHTVTVTVTINITITPQCRSPKSTSSLLSSPSSLEHSPVYASQSNLSTPATVNSSVVLCPCSSQGM